MSVGSVTVRLRPAAAAGLRDAVAAALQKIEADDPSRGAPRPASRGDDLPS
ncbi:hypothetical protein OV090_36285 [Nannocystis sp. RBIL2]|uniref:hypothetical protein n=1 Tax=Nannocystis sp. RBIL2 TaxID=2996788 RepID=UPI002271F71B|nr:hypothetical protein [Nannocystis sp. RBIL2]MCY1070259.1 hypothetical protein [Nannocystis sp. RBIL2]